MEFMDQNELNLFEVPTLEVGDRLFLPSGDGRMSVACLNFGDTRIGYVRGFKMASDLLVKHVLFTREDQDYLVYPIVFGYRHYLELRLKDLLRDASRLLDAPEPAPAVLNDHRLLPLWDALRPLLDQIFGQSVVMDHIRDCIREFHEIDPRSFAFGYSTTTQDMPSLPADLRAINLANLLRTMEKIGSTLDGCDTGISEYLDGKAESDRCRAEVTEENRAYAQEMREEFRED